ncbi:TatD family hydrolase [Wolbachia endosymbiont (group B) of Limnophora tigrina]|uniref:TatD family hydrolase n=1 Tax=Wolbachia endosymbiont (group B) of Limnophora tigrina TaxID=3139317 RepID=UPI0035B533AC
MIVDSHCHLIYFSDNEIPKVISRAEQNGVKILHNICVSIDDIPKLLKISSSYDQVYFSVGIHPLDAAIENGECIHADELVEFTKNQKVISIGETGLDFYKSDNKDNQKKSFASHIEAARITGLPLVIHTRNADDEMIDILKSEMKTGTFGGVMHCFASSKELAYQSIDLGLYISFSGIITFKNASLLRGIAQSVPRERVLVETDAPYLSPEPYRGKKNEPAMVKYVVDCLAELWNESPDKVAEITTSNFFRLFTKLELQGNSIKPLICL